MNTEYLHGGPRPRVGGTANPARDDTDECADQAHEETEEVGGKTGIAG